MSPRPTILFVTDSLPFPPRNGRELPIAKYLTELGREFTVDLVVLVPDDAQEWIGRPATVPAEVRALHRVRYKRMSPLKAGIEEVVGGRPAFYIRGFNEADVRASMGDAPYDFVWVSPVRAIGFLDYCAERGIRVANRIALGLNDVKTTMYMGGVAEAFASGPGSRMYQKAWRAVRVPHLFFHERRYLRRCDLVHVQTALEKKRAHRIVGKTNGKPSIVAVPNGRKAELEAVQYKGVDSAHVLLMTHLAGRRERETSWFIEKVWPEVRRRVPAGRLQIVGTPPAPSSELHNRKADGIDIIGYADSLPAMFESIAVSVVPVFHSTGLNNRVLDSLTAGVPIVATPDALGTIDGLQDGVHALAASTRSEFVDALAGLLLDRDKRIRLAQQARTFGMQQPTWEEGASILAGALRRLQ
jgi:hypothetical protein